MNPTTIATGNIIWGEYFCAIRHAAAHAIFLQPNNSEIVYRCTKLWLTYMHTDHLFLYFVSTNITLNIVADDTNNHTDR